VALMRSGYIVLTRRQIAGWVGLVGGVALLAGLIGWIWQGSLTGFVPYSLGVGVVGLVIWIAFDRHALTDILTGRQTRYGTMAVALTLLLIAIVSTAYLLVARQTLTVDMTQNGRYSLSPKTFDVLRNVRRDIQLTGFYSPRVLQQREVDDEFFRLYSAANPLIHRVYIDPDQQPALAQQYGVNGDAALYISYLNADHSVDMSTLARVPRSGTQERDITQAISRLLISGSITVYFEIGHGGRNALDTSDDGLSGINNGIKESGIITQPLDLTELAKDNKPVPQDAGAIIMPRLTTDLSAAEIGILDAYLKRGGTLFIMSEAFAARDAFLRHDSTFNQYLWTNYRIDGLDAVIVDPAASVQTPLDVIGAGVNTGTDITARLDPAHSPIKFRIARALEVGTDLPDGVTNGQLVFSSNSSYGETDLDALANTNTYKYDDGVDIQGPLTEIAWASNNNNQSRIVLVGDSDFVSNGLVQTQGNAVFFTDALAWLTGYNQRINFGSQAYFYNLPLITIDRPTLDRIAFVTIILVPGLVLISGLVVTSRRARR
jgi:hypothetical protein